MPTPPWGQGLRQLPLSPELRIQLHLPKAPSTAQGTRAATPCPAPSTQGAVVPHFAHVLSCFPSPASTPQPLTWRGENQPTEERLRWCLFQLKAGSLQVTPGIKPPCLAPIQDPVGEVSPTPAQPTPFHWTGLHEKPPVLCLRARLHLGTDPCLPTRLVPLIQQELDHRQTQTKGRV